MTYAVSRAPTGAGFRHDGTARWSRSVAAACAVLALGLLATTGPASAQDPAAAPPAAKAAPPAKAAAKDGGDKKTQWVKLCDKIKVRAKDDTPADGKEPPAEEKQLCSTMFEAIESNSGQLIVSVGLQQMEGAPKQILAVMVPLGVVIPGGVKLALYSADQWAKAAKNEKIELKDLKTADLKFAHCLPVGCTAEAQATPELVEMLKANAGLAVLAIWANGNQFTVPVPLNGFGEALAGKPIDNKEYQANRRKLMEHIMQRQAELREKEKAEKMKELPPPPPGMAGTAPAAPGGAPAKK
jgi:invasion protein IalB